MAQHRCVTEIALKSSFLCVKRSLTRYGFRAGARVIRYNVNIALFTFSCLLSSLKLREVTNHECIERLIKYIYIYIFSFLLQVDPMILPIIARFSYYITIFKSKLRLTFLK